MLVVQCFDGSSKSAIHASWEQDILDGNWSGQMLQSDLQARVYWYVWQCHWNIIKGPDNPTTQFPPIISTKCCSGDGEGRKDKGGGGGSRSKTSCMWRVVCDKVACEKRCVAKKDGAQRPTRSSLALLHEANERHHCAMQSALQQSPHASVTSIAKSPMSPKILTWQ